MSPIDPITANFNPPPHPATDLRTGPTGVQRGLGGGGGGGGVQAQGGGRGGGRRSGADTVIAVHFVFPGSFIDTTQTNEFSGDPTCGTEVALANIPCLIGKSSMTRQDRPSRPDHTHVQPPPATHTHARRCVAGKMFFFFCLRHRRSPNTTHTSPRRPRARLHPGPSGGSRLLPGQARLRKERDAAAKEAEAHRRNHAHAERRLQVRGELALMWRSVGDSGPCCGGSGGAVEGVRCLGALVHGG